MNSGLWSTCRQICFGDAGLLGVLGDRVTGEFGAQAQQGQRLPG